MPIGCPDKMVQFLHAAKSPDGVRETSFTMTYAHLINFCTKQDERKEWSSSGLHYGHVKSLAYDDTLLRIKYKIIEMAYRHGVLLRRWTTLCETLMPKKQRALIHKL